MKQCSDGKRRSATKTLARLIANATSAVRSRGNHPTECCLEYANVELSIFNSVITGDITNEHHELGSQDVPSECDDQLCTSDYSVQRVVQHALFLPNRVVETSLLLCSPNWRKCQIVIRPADSHDYMWQLWVPMMAIDNNPRKLWTCPEI